MSHNPITYAMRHDYLLNRQKCTRCGKQDAFTLNGRAWCADCIDEDSEYRKERYAENEEIRKATNQSSKSRYNLYKSLGLCTKCGNKAIEKRTLCQRCNAKAKAYSQARRGVSNSDLGLCRSCGAERKEGFKFCEKCLPAKQEHGRKVLAMQSRDNHFWRKDNSLLFAK